MGWPSPAAAEHRGRPWLPESCQLNVGHLLRHLHRRNLYVLHKLEFTMQALPAAASAYDSPVQHLRRFQATAF